jgi:hypothetical protein
MCEKPAGMNRRSALKTVLLAFVPARVLTAPAVAQVQVVVEQPQPCGEVGPTAERMAHYSTRPDL